MMVRMAADGARVGRTGRDRARGRPWPVLVVVALLGAGLAAGCTGDDPESTDDGTQRPVALEVRIASCAGRADEDARSALESGIGDTLSSYVVAGFLGDYPREDFVSSFEVFTSGAARDAAGDIDVLTAADYQDAERVDATRLRARISCLAPGGKVTGATAHVELDFAADEGGPEPTPFTLSGRFLLVPGPRGWSVFGYDVARDDLDRAASS
jgi:hypothetical protein